MLSATVNLIPDELYISQAMRRRTAFWIVVGVLSLSGLAALSYMGRQRLAAHESGLEQLRGQVSSMHLWEQQLAPLQHRLQSAYQRQEVIRGMLNQPDWNGLLAAIAQQAGTDLWVTSLNTDTAEQNLGEVGSITATTVAIDGVATTSAAVTRFVAALKTSHHVDELHIVRAQASTEPRLEGAIEFALTGVITREEQ